VKIGELGSLRLNGMQLLFSQVAFKKEFFADKPQCRGCEHIDVLVMDHEIYPAFKKRHCEPCEKYKGW
jgi:hypothetical protein